MAAFADAICGLGPANFLYADGDALFAHGHKRLQADRGIRPPGLHVLRRHCALGASAVSTAGLSIGPVDGEQHVVLLASVPLTREPGWRALGEGELIAARDGAILEWPRTLSAALGRKSAGD